MNVVVEDSAAQLPGASETRDALVEATSRIFRDLGDPQNHLRAGDKSHKPQLWQALDDAGLTRAWVPEALGGAGAGISDGFEILTTAGRFAVAIPLAETMLAAWLLSQAGLAVPGGMLSVAPVLDEDRIALNQDGTLTGSAGAVPFARAADYLAVLAWKATRPVIALVERNLCAIEPCESIAREPRDRVCFENLRPSAIADAPAAFCADNLIWMGAAIRAAQMSGALQALLDRSVQYANERVAFGRPIAKFQAIQHNLARLAGESAAALAAAGSAADAISQAQAFDDAVFLEVASAKIRVGEAAGRGAAIAHQVHGAIGFSQEHPLHRYSQRLWAWRDDFGGESVWAVRLGQRVAALGADALWPTLSGR